MSLYDTFSRYKCFHADLLQGHGPNQATTRLKTVMCVMFVQNPEPVDFREHQPKVVVSA